MLRGERPPRVCVLGAGLAIALVAARSRGDPLLATSPWDAEAHLLVAATMLGVTAITHGVPAGQAADANPTALLRT